jgi:hypothetical protein
LRVLALPHRPKDVLKRYASDEEGILLEARPAARRPTAVRGLTPHVCDPQEFSMFISAASKTHELLSLIPLDLLHDVRSLFSLVSRSGKSLDRQARCPHARSRASRVRPAGVYGAEMLRGAAGARDAGGLSRPGLE